ncbi:metalloregulator ArsR/SmtB family transcription factor [uncultured Shimia sp.]|uniref:ArsR/SmtB family transcription factor n=1 Tax=uncultured Shimia sp. TaxID=573152 RepID=UPI00262F28E9|nr:metalloregulator ArsR/SmtB family transcription factor [uncultured Shimia sp.]
MKEIDQKFAALSDHTRRAILARLTAGEANAGELAAPLPISQPAVSQHLKVLIEAGMVEREARGQQRIYRLAPGALDGIDGYLGGLRQALEANYARLDALLDDMQNKQN